MGCCPSRDGDTVKLVARDSASAQRETAIEITNIDVREGERSPMSSADAAVARPAAEQTCGPEQTRGAILSR